ncbi:metallophosphoesterase [Flavobacterium faecale]|uniref:Metallophosphoesterase n=1 Tax=Flavobacterium faecale TaxID=1355330 RepID=A0A2S1LH84_9FLAO|nr:ligase-associated DNA damage response endonuclease PdeM [Flavobacterium faecale]AWG23114.1 metallophosphoesterase [Flavobacterium faecale]
MQITIRKQNFILHHLGAMYWVEKKILLVSDVHFGKVMHFRKYGIAIPTAIIKENFANLDVLLATYTPEKVVFLGDLFHSKINNEWNMFEEWISNQVNCSFVLIEGNHDVIGRDYYTDLQIKVLPQMVIDDFLLTHHPEETIALFNFCGHLHPGVELKGIGRQFLKLACFFQSENQMILPAFGSFTGKYFIKPTTKNTIYAIADTTVFEIAKT